MATTAARVLLQPCRHPLRHTASAAELLSCAANCSPPTSSPLLSASRMWNLAGATTHRKSRDNQQARHFSSTSPARSHDAARFHYNVAASYIAKGKQYDPTRHVFHFNPYNRVQPPKQPRVKSARPESGQDAFFVSRLGDVNGGVALGVADGVGGWMESGVDPADFSHAFCDYMAGFAHTYKSGQDKALTGTQLIQKGYEAVCHNPTIQAGGSTAIVGLLGDDGVLEVANLGDSGFIHLRLNGVHAYSEPQTHAFNTPYQLSVVPPSMLLRAATFGGSQLMDRPQDAEVTRHGLRHGDVLVFASDGLWDNLFNQDILRIVSNVMSTAGAWTKTESGIRVVPDLTPYTQLEGAEADEGKPRQRSISTLQSLLATAIVGSAKAASADPKLDGPFAKEVKKYYPGETWRGGKEDDICVVTVVVSEQEPVKARL